MVIVNVLTHCDTVRMVVWITSRHADQNNNRNPNALRLEYFTEEFVNFLCSLYAPLVDSDSRRGFFDERDYELGKKIMIHSSFTFA